MYVPFLIGATGRGGGMGSVDIAVLFTCGPVIVSISPIERTPFYPLVKWETKKNGDVFEKKRAKKKKNRVFFFFLMWLNSCIFRRKCFFDLFFSGKQLTLHWLGKHYLRTIGSHHFRPAINVFLISTLLHSRFDICFLT